jgi:hypothetical protein
MPLRYRIVYQMFQKVFAEDFKQVVCGIVYFTKHMACYQPFKFFFLYMDLLTFIGLCIFFFLLTLG